MRRLATMTLAALPMAGALGAGAPSQKDFASGVYLLPGGTQPVQQAVLPDAVYDGVTRADLADLRVFNSAGIVVPHGLCANPEPLAAETRESALAVFPLTTPRAAPGPGGGELRIEAPNGAIATYRDPRGSASGITGNAPENAAWVVDAGSPPPEIRALRFSWTTADGASELAVRVEASDDLNRWRTIVPGATLLRTAADGRVLERTQVDLPPGPYRYLRVERADRGPPPQIHSVLAETALPARAPEPFRFAAAPVAEVAPDGAFLFETGRLAPVHTAQVELPAPNMSVEAELDSRATREAPWQRRWSGRVSTIQAAQAHAAFAPVADPYWRVRVRRGAETLGSARPTLRLGYHPARLQFAAQGEGPWVLAFGSARATPAESAACDALLAGMAKEDVGAAQVETAPDSLFGGTGAYVAPPKPTPVRRIVLWIVLVAGAGLLLAMALNLRRRLGTPAG